MHTRAKSKAGLQQEEGSGAASLSSPPATPATNHDKQDGYPTLIEKAAIPITFNGETSGELLPSPMSGASIKRKRMTRKSAAEPVSGGWDVLPHGLGKKGDLTEGSTVDQSVSNEIETPAKKRLRGGRNAEVANITTAQNDSGDVKLEAPVEGKDLAQILKEVEDYHNQAIRNPTVKDEDFEDEKPKKKRVTRKKNVVSTDKNVLDKVDEIIDASGNVPKKERQKKHKYGLTPGYSPFPDHAMPTPEACEEVNRLLSELHGTVEQPNVVPPPSMDVTGCGEVPDLLDAILRTKLSASTTANNANISLKGLKDKFGLRTAGAGRGSVNWEAVYEADLETVIESIKSGGLAKTKGTDIKKILDMVYKRNLSRRDELLKEKETGIQADVLGTKHETRDQKDAELAKFEETLLTMDHVFEMTTDEAMEEMTKLPGIGVKTASCVILFCMKRPSFAVDTHVWRHCKWLGWVPEKATRDQTFSHCEVRVPDHLKYSLHQLFLRHGKTCGRCRANTSAGTKEWEEANCPIEHLVSRKGARKTAGASPRKKATSSTTTKKTKARGGKNGKNSKNAEDGETEETNIEIDIESDENEESENGLDEET